MPQESTQTDWGVDQLRNAFKAAGVALWTWNVDDDALLMDGKGTNFGISNIAGR